MCGVMFYDTLRFVLRITSFLNPVTFRFADYIILNNPICKFLIIQVT